MEPRCKQRWLVVLLLGMSGRAEALGGVASQVFVNGMSGPGAMANTFLGLTGDRGVTATESSRYCLSASAGVLRDLYLKSDVAPGAGNTYVATVFKGTGAGAGVATSLTTTLSGASQTTNNDSTNEVSVAAGDTLTVKFTTTGIPGNANLRFAVRFLPTTATESFYCGGPSVGTLSTTGTEFLSIQGSGGLSATEANSQVLVPIAGTLTALYVQLETVPGGTATRDFTVMLNGVAQTMTCNVGAGAKTCSTTANPVTLAAGDKVSIKSVPNTTPAATKAKVSVAVQATTNGESFIGECNDANLTNTATTFEEVDHASSSNAATETSTDVLALAMTVKNAYCFVQTGPAAGTTWAFNFRQNVVSAGPSCTIANPNTTCNNSTSVVLAANDLINWQVVPTGTPTATPGACSVAVFTNPRRNW